MARKSIFLPQQRFGRLVMIEEVFGHKVRYWRCHCDCGNDAVVRQANLVFGLTRSCGCLYRESRHTVRRTHGLSDRAEYQIWCGMIKRCYDANDTRFTDYGGRGIAICDRWRHNFTAFFEDMGERPTPEHSIDRHDCNGPYSPDNCSWATALEQGLHRRNNRYLTYNGETFHLREWSRRIGVKESTLWQRLNRNGWSIERTLTEQPFVGKNQHRR